MLCQGEWFFQFLARNSSIVVSEGWGVSGVLKRDIPRPIDGSLAFISCLHFTEGNKWSWKLIAGVTWKIDPILITSDSPHRDEASKYKKGIRNKLLGRLY